MTTSHQHQTKRVFSIILMALAGLVLLVSAWMGIAMIVNTPIMFSSLRMAFQGPVFDMLFERILQLATAAGVGLIVLGSLLAGAIYGAGYLLRRNAALLERIEQLERSQA
jgi:hypothetical protein